MSESFKSAMERLREYRWQHATNDEDVIPLLARLQRAYDHDIEQHMREQYARGYEDGQHSMDAEHRAVALRLQQLPLDEDSHGNLNQIARALYHSDWGWTQGACRGLRDELIRLMGGIHDDPVSVGEPSDADCDDCHRGAGESGRIAKLKQQRDELQAKLDAATHDDGAYKSKVELLCELILKNDRIKKLQSELGELRDRLHKIKAITNASDKAHRDA